MKGYLPMIDVTRRVAFTLVEVLVSLVLVSILSGMVLTAVQGVTQQARLTRTKSIISLIDSVLQEQYESYKYRPLPVVTPDSATALPAGVLELVVLPSEAARVRLNMIRDLQRMEMPDRISDILAGTSFNRPAEIYAATSRIMYRDNSGTLIPIQRDNVLANRITRRVEWYGDGSSLSNVPSRFAGYVRRSQGVTWSELHQASECLYLILASSFVGGTPAIEMIPASNIGDTDGDGMFEILDGWGRPIEFIRWPSGYFDPELAIDQSIPDDFDLLRSDFGFIVNELTGGSGDDIANPWSMRPLIISGGANGLFGIHFAARDSGGADVGFRYNSATPGSLQLMAWAPTSANMGPEHQGRTGTYIFVDPYYRKVGISTRPGFPIAGAESDRSDNITNYQLAASE